MAAAMREVEVAAGEIAARHGGKVLAIADARRPSPLLLGAASAGAATE